MQINSVGNNHDSSSHQVTNCMHTHAAKKEGGGMRSSAGNVSVSAQQTVATQPEGQLSLSAWLDRTLGGAKKLLGRIWGGNETAANGMTGTQTGEAQVLAQINENSLTEGMGADVSGQNRQQPDVTHAMSTAQIAAAATAVSHPQTSQSNPYFSAIEDTGRQQETIWQRVKVKFKDVAGKLMGHLPGRFAGFLTQNSFQTKQERPKEDLRRRSKYREDEVEIDCVLTDDSYLLDSYDKKGEYSKLSAGK